MFRYMPFFYVTFTRTPGDGALSPISSASSQGSSACHVCKVHMMTAVVTVL